MAIPKITCLKCEKSYAKRSIHLHTCWPIKICPVCNVKFSKESITCSHACANSFFRSGENNPNWKQDSYKSTCFLYHDKKCVICGEINIVEVHHYNNIHNDNRPENLVPLCPTHHQYWHSNHKHLVQDIIVKYVEDFIKLRVGKPG